MAEGNNQLKMEQVEKMIRDKILKRLRRVYARSGKKGKRAVCRRGVPTGSGVNI